MKPTSKTDTSRYKVRELPLLELYERGLIPGRNVEPYIKGYQFGPCFVLAGHSDHGWHMSISHIARYPTWDEVRDACLRFIPREVTMAMMVPSNKEPYVNLMSNCFHLWQVIGNQPASFLQPEAQDAQQAG